MDFRNPAVCATSIFIGEGGIAIDGSVFTKDSFFLSWAAWSSPNDFKTIAGTHYDFGFSLTGFYSVGVGEHSLFMEPQVPDTISLLDMPAGKLNLAKLKAQAPIGIHGGALAFDYATGMFALVTDAAAMTDLVHSSPGKYLTWAAVDRAGGDAFVWVECDDTLSFSDPTIWTAPYTTDPTAVVKHKVAKISEGYPWGGESTVANAGMTLSRMGLGARLTRLSDGAGWSVAAEPGEHVARPLWVDDNEIWFATELDTMGGANPAGTNAPTGITRIRRDALPAPDLGPGF